MSIPPERLSDDTPRLAALIREWAGHDWQSADSLALWLETRGVRAGARPPEGPSSVSRTPAQANVTDLANSDRRPASDASAHAEAEFERGFQDGFTSVPSKPISRAFVRGYEKGVEARNIGRVAPSEASPRPPYRDGAMK